MRLPDDLDQLAHVDVVRNQELGLVQNRELLLSLVSLNDHLQQHNRQEVRRLSPWLQRQLHPESLRLNSEMTETAANCDI